MLLNTCFYLDYLQISVKAVPLQCVFHSIRFKVNKGWSKALLLFLCPYPNILSTGGSMNHNSLRSTPNIEFQSFQHLTNHIIFLKRVIKHTNLLGLFAIFAESRTFATVFFIVLDLRLTKVGARRCSFFYARTYLSPSIRLL